MHTCMACKKVTVIFPKSIMCENILHAKTYYMSKHITCQNILHVKTYYMPNILYVKTYYMQKRIIGSKYIA